MFFQNKKKINVLLSIFLYTRIIVTHFQKLDQFHKSLHNHSIIMLFIVSTDFPAWRVRVTFAHTS